MEKLRNGGSVPLSAVVNPQALAGSPELGGSGMLMKSDQNSPPSSLGAQDVKMVIIFVFSETCTVCVCEIVNHYMFASFCLLFLCVNLLIILFNTLYCGCYMYDCMWC